MLEIEQVLKAALVHEGCGWNMGSFGAIAEFHHVTGDPTPQPLEGLQQEILALRSRAPESGLSRELQSELNSVDEAELAEVVAAEEEALAASERISELTDTTLSSLSSGDVVDEEA